MLSKVIRFDQGSAAWLVVLYDWRDAASLRLKSFARRGAKARTRARGRAGNLIVIGCLSRLSLFFRLVSRGSVPGTRRIYMKILQVTQSCGNCEIHQARE